MIHLRESFHRITSFKLNPLLDFSFVFDFKFFTLVVYLITLKVKVADNLPVPLKKEASSVVPVY